MWYYIVFFFFFQAEDGIRDYKVTGVQTCALPICSRKSCGLVTKNALCVGNPLSWFVTYGEKWPPTSPERRQPSGRLVPRDPDFVILAHLPHADGKGRVSDARGVGARLIGGGGDVSEEDETRTARAFTEEGSVVGSAPYMSPEQVEERQVDARSDIFSYGAVL